MIKKKQFKRISSHNPIKAAGKRKIYVNKKPASSKIFIDGLGEVNA
jgi:hypothetical protein